MVEPEGYTALLLFPHLFILPLPDLNFTDTKTVSLGAILGTATFNYILPVPDTILAGGHNVEVSLALPSGSEIKKTVVLAVPAPALTSAYQGLPNVAAGDNLNILVENTGGLDEYVTYDISLSGKGVPVFQNTLSEMLAVGASKSLSIQVPLQAVSGDYTLNVNFSGLKGAKASIITPLTVQGLSPSVSLSTSQPSYLSNENVSWSTSISNGALQIASANLHIEAVKKCGDVKFCQETVQWQTDVPVTQGANTVQTYNNIIGLLPATGLFYLRGTLTSSTGQIVWKGEYPFSVINAGFALNLKTNKAIYAPGETVTVTGEIINKSPDASFVSAVFPTPTPGMNFFATGDVFIPAYGTYSFTFNAIAPASGLVTYTGKVMQNSSTLVEAQVNYEVVMPDVLMTVTMPDVANNDPFNIGLELVNRGRADADVSLYSYSAATGLDDSRVITIPPGEKRVVPYTQQITSDADYYFSAYVYYTNGPQDVFNTVAYGLGAGITLGASGIISPVGKVAVPVTVTNTGLLDETLQVKYQLYNQGVVSTQETRSYYLQKGSSTSDTLYYDLPAGQYVVIAQTSLPTASSAKTITTAKENDVTLTWICLYGGDEYCRPLPTRDGGISVQPGTLYGSGIIYNNGWNTIDGKIRLSATKQGVEVWNSEPTMPQLPPTSSYQLNYTVDLGGFELGTYDLKTSVYNNAGQELISHISPFTVRGPNFAITNMPANPVFAAGQNAVFNFALKNTGNQSGEFKFAIKAMDSLDAAVNEWLKPGEEKNYAFNFLIPNDIEEKDYIAFYQLGEQKGQIKFHVSGVSLAVNATLDSQSYNPGATAQLTLAVNDLHPDTAGRNLFARVNYAGFEEVRPFTLSGSSTLNFSVPLTTITGEKLFYGIYHESGRSIHLNSLYIYGAGNILNIGTDKQVYNPGETVVVTLSGNTSGTITLSGPGNYSETFAFTGFATKSFVLPMTMTAGTYYVNYQIMDAGGQIFSESHPFDVAGIQVKVKEAVLDKAKYASSDTLKLDLTVESNQNIVATLKTWVIDPDGKYTKSGEQGISLSSIENLLVTQTSTLNTAVSGIHRLVYGIYNGDILLSSGAEAFDVGDAVLLGVSTDRADYPAGTEVVTVNAELYGTVGATLDFYLDGQYIKTDPINLSGFSTFSTQIGTVIPGSHVLKVVLTAGGLTSTKETSFVYGSSLPDLTVGLSFNSSQITLDNGKINVTVSNLGKTASGTTSLSIYDGNPLAGGTLIGTINIGPLVPGQSAQVTLDWNVMGYPGNHTLYGVVDPSQNVIEFNDSNNTTAYSTTVPNMTLNLFSAENSYSAGEVINIDGFVTNLGNTAYTGAQVITSVTNSQGVEVYNKAATMDLQPLSVTSTPIAWNSTGASLGVYTVVQKAMYNMSILSENSLMVSLINTVPAVQLLTPTGGDTLTGTYHITWHATDADGNPLNIDIAYSNDGGSNWFYLASNQVNDGDFQWDTSVLPDGSNYKIKVIAKDGFATATAESGVVTLLNSGALKVNSMPAGARVYLDGNYGYLGAYQGTTGLNIPTIRAGKHLVRLTYPGYNDYYQLVDVAAGVEAQVMAILVPKPSVSFSHGVPLTAQGMPIDVNGYSTPFVVDWNMDGKKDLIVGNAGGQILLYMNSGTDEAPIFDSPAVIYTGDGYIAPFAVDWDNDGKKDIIVGSTYGDVLLLRNSGTDISPVFEPGVVVVRVSNSAIPFVVDWDGDGRKDIVVGAGDGALNLYLNKGTDNQPAFNALPDAMPLVFGTNLAPFVVTDWDADGKKDLLVGNSDGNIYLYLNSNTNESPVFGAGQPVQGSYGPLNVLGNSTPFVVDFNNDGLMDIVSGNRNGVVNLFIATPSLITATIDIDPNTLSKKSKGQWVTCYIELPAGYKPADIDISSLLLQGAIPAEYQPATIGDYDSDGIPDLMVKFDRQHLQSILNTGENVTVTLTGRLKDNRNIKGEDHIRVTQ